MSAASDPSHSSSPTTLDVQQPLESDNRQQLKQEQQQSEHHQQESSRTTSRCDDMADATGARDSPSLAPLESLTLLGTKSSDGQQSLKCQPSELADQQGGQNVNQDSDNISPGTNDSASVDNERRYRPQKYCAVCGDKAIACNFNAVTCESCKAFFRRNAFKEQRLKCLFENRCFITRNTRRFCSKCRLLKCFQIGMKREWILTDEQKQIKRVKIMQNKQNRQETSQSPVSQDLSPCQASVANSADNSDGRRSAASETKHASDDYTPRLTFRNRHLSGSVETRDVGTSCPDELDLVNPNGCLVHYCSLAYQCQFCSLRLAGCPATSVQPAAIVDYHSHHQRRQLTHNYQNMQFRDQVTSVANYEDQLAANAHLSTAHQPACCCSEHSIHQPHSNQSGVSQSHFQPGQTCVVNSSNNIQQSPQLHLMNPAQVQVQRADNSPAGVFVSPFAIQMAVVASAGQPNRSPSVAAQTPLSAPLGYTGVLANGVHHSGPFFVSLDARPTYNTFENARELQPSSCASSGQQSSSDSPPSSVDLTQVCSSNATSIATPIPAEPTEPNTETPISHQNSSEDNSTGSTNLSNAQAAPSHEPSQSQVQSNPLLQAECRSGASISWNQMSFNEPAETEAEVMDRICKYEFSHNERELLNEMVSATRFMYETGKSSEGTDCLNRIVFCLDAALRNLIKTVKQIKSFRLLEMNDQIMLLKTNCFKILLLRSTHHFNDELGGWTDTKTGKVMKLDVLKMAKKSLVFERHRDLIKLMPRPLRRDRLIMSLMSLSLLFDSTVELDQSNSVIDNATYMKLLRKYIIFTQPDPLAKYESLVSALQVVNACNDEYNVFFSKDCQPEQITPLLIEIFDISINNVM